MTAEARQVGASRWADAEIQTLRPEHIRSLRLGWQHRHNADEIRRILSVYPGRSVWLPETREFVLVAPWRNRDQIASLTELAAVRNTEALVTAAVERSQTAGATLVLMAELDERRRPAFYDRIGFSELEEVITYELDRPGTRLQTLEPLTFAQVSIADAARLQTVLAIDHRAFPWLWWNTPEELAAYALTPGVSIHLGLLNGVPVSYIGTTSYPGWGHLDRIAVDPNYQGLGLGKASLSFACAMLARRGAKRIGLSTQAENVRSQRMYERFGFRRARINDYRLFGVWLREP